MNSRMAASAFSKRRRRLSSALQDTISLGFENLKTEISGSADQRISGSAVDGAPTEEPRSGANNARRQ
jgi:hypothetical protein